MIATAFDEENMVLFAPDNSLSKELADNCEPLPVWRGEIDAVDLKVSVRGFISCWKMTKEELEEIQKTGRIWLYIYGDQHPPVGLGANSPFEKDKEDGK